MKTIKITDITLKKLSEERKINLFQSEFDEFKNNDKHLEYFNNVDTYKYVDESGAIKHYAENYYFSTANAIYKITYACENGVGYDETFSLKDFLDVNFDFKENI